MSLTKSTTNLNNIQSLPDIVDDTWGTSDQLKQKYDKSANDLQSDLNIALTEQDVINANIETRTTTNTTNIATNTTNIATNTTDIANRYTKTEVDNFTVKLTGDQSVSGVKTFVSNPIVPTPITDMQASTKKYVDDVALAFSLGAVTNVQDSQLSNTAGQIKPRVAQLEIDIGTMASLNTTDKTSIVNAINEAHTDVNSMIPKSLLTTQGDIIYATGLSTPTRLPKGTALQGLRMNAGATAPEWATIDVSKQIGSTFTLGTPASSFTIGGLDINRDGGMYEIQIDNLTASTTSDLQMYLNGDTTATNYYNGTTVNNSNVNNTARISLNSTAVSNSTIILKTSGSKATAILEGCINNTANVFNNYYSWSYKTTITNISSITFSASTGNINTATVNIYKR